MDKSISGFEFLQKGVFVRCGDDEKHFKEIQFIPAPQNTDDKMMKRLCAGLEQINHPHRPVIVIMETVKLAPAPQSWEWPKKRNY